MRYTIQIVGGPSRTGGQAQNAYHGGQVEIKFDVENQTIASVDIFREVVGHEVGDTLLSYEIIQTKPGKSGVSRRSVVSKKVIPIRVRLVTSINVPYNN